MRRALDALEPNERYRPLFEAALARQRADWLYGMNLTRLYTLRAGLSVGAAVSLVISPFDAFAGCFVGDGVG